MHIDKMKELISQGEGLTVEFKESKHKLSKDALESVCAFLNRDGGHLFLGVSDNGSIVGVDIPSADKIKKEFATAINNLQQLSPTFYLSIQDAMIDGKLILYINVPQSSQVHRCRNKIYDRNEDGDFDITNNTNLVSNLYLRKQSTYTENKIFPFATLDELDLPKSGKQQQIKRLIILGFICRIWNS